MITDSRYSTGGSGDDSIYETSYQASNSPVGGDGGDTIVSTGNDNESDSLWPANDA